MRISLVPLVPPTPQLPPPLRRGNIGKQFRRADGQAGNPVSPDRKGNQIRFAHHFPCLYRWLCRGNHLQEAHKHHPVFGYRRFDGTILLIAAGFLRLPLLRYLIPYFLCYDNGSIVRLLRGHCQEQMFVHRANHCIFWC